MKLKYLATSVLTIPLFFSGVANAQTIDKDILAAIKKYDIHENAKPYVMEKLSKCITYNKNGIYNSSKTKDKLAKRLNELDFDKDGNITQVEAKLY